MNIAIFSSMFPPIQTGTSFYTYNLAKALAEKSNDVILITAKNNIQNENDENLIYPVIRLRAIHFKMKSFFNHLRVCSIFPSNYKTASNSLKKFRPDLILLVNHYLDISLVAIYCARILQVPLVISIGTQIQSSYCFRNLVLKTLDRLVIGLFILQFADKIISWDKEIDRYIKDTYSYNISKKTKIIHFGYNGDATLYKNHTLSLNKSNQILGVGAITQQRPYIFEVKVFKALLSIYPELNFKIIGNVYNREVIRVIKELDLHSKVILTGEKPHSYVLSEMKKSAIHWMMLNATYVGLGTANIEAMMLGLPVISNIPKDLFGEDNLLEDMVSYIYTDGKDVNKIKNKITLLLKERYKLELIGKTGKEFAEVNFNWNKIACDFIEFFKEIVIHYKY